MAVSDYHLPMPAHLDGLWGHHLEGEQQFLGTFRAGKVRYFRHTVSMLRSLVSHFLGNPLCVGCEQRPVVADYLCQYCLAKVAAFTARSEGRIDRHNTLNSQSTHRGITINNPY